MVIQYQHRMHINYKKSASVKYTVKVHVIMITLYITTVSTVSTNTIDENENGNSENYNTIY